MCIHFEESEYVKSQFDFNDVIAKTKKTHRSTKIVAPVAVIKNRDFTSGLLLCLTSKHQTECV